MQLHLVLVALCPVADKFEPANHLAYRKETKHFRSDDTSRIPLLAGDVPDLLEQVGGRLLSSAVGLASSTVHESGGVAEEVQSGLEVALHGLDGAVHGLTERRTLHGSGVSHFVDTLRNAYGGAMLRWCAMSLPSSIPTRP